MSDPIKSWRMTSNTARSAKATLDGLRMKRPLDQLLSEWRGVGRHQTVTFGGAAGLVSSALAAESDARRAAAAMSDDELAEALNEWHLRKSERGE